MIKAIISNNVKRETKVFNDNTTLRAALEDVGIDYTRGAANLDGAPLGPGDLDKSFRQMGITSKCYLSVIVKADNAMI